MTTPPGSPSRRGWLRLKITERSLRLMAVGAVILMVVLPLAFRNWLPSAETVAYPAVFLLSLFSSSSVLLPAPGVVVVCLGGAALNPLLVGLLAGVAETLGEITGYMAGFSGRELIKGKRIARRLQPWAERRGWLAVLVFASIPNPFFDVVGIAAGAMRMPLWQFVGAAWLGKTAKSLALAYACSLGYDVLRLLR